MFKRLDSGFRRNDGTRMLEPHKTLAKGYTIGDQIRMKAMSWVPLSDRLSVVPVLEQPVTKSIRICLRALSYLAEQGFTDFDANLRLT